MNPDQIAPLCSQGEQSYQGPYCLHYRLPKKISRNEEQMTKVVIGRQKVEG